MSRENLTALHITNGNADIAAAYADYCHELLGYGANLRTLFDAADAHPDCVLINANAAALHLAFEGREGWQDAKPYLANMNSHLSGLPAQEALFCAAINTWAAQDFSQTLALFAEIAKKWPTDLVAIKWGQYHAFNLGDRAALLTLGALAVSASPDKPYVHGLYAFALEQNHQLRAAEKQALHAVEIAIDDAWAHHAHAHVMESEGRAADGATWLGHCAHIWESKGTFIREHNWWHAALFHLALGEHDKVFEIYDKRLWGEWPEFPQEQIGASSMLWRLELHGLDPGDRWLPVIEQARTRSGDHLFPFHDLHYLFALTRSGNDQDAEQHYQSMQARAEACCENTATAWQKGGLPTAAGILAYARGQTREAVRHLETALPYLEYIGGSHAQRAIFHETYARAKMRTDGKTVALGE